ncbi:hypothetical protein WG219_03685 [Ectopseudomonas mendocina]|uniref:Uncharacterized protein n=1 Tax=Ectopseudomonas mendocina TaxID=300 RepID=A0ABZ2RJJ1_ECTME
MRIEGGTTRLITTLTASLPASRIHLCTEVVAAYLDENGAALRLSPHRAFVPAFAASTSQLLPGAKTGAGFWVWSRWLRTLLVVVLRRRLSRKRLSAQSKMSVPRSVTAQLMARG